MQTAYALLDPQKPGLLCFKPSFQALGRGGGPAASKAKRSQSPAQAVPSFSSQHR